MKIENYPIAKIIPYVRNPRKNDNAVEKVASSIKEFGFRQPIVVDEELVIIAGHTRYESAKRLGMETVPVHVAKGLTPQQVKAYRIADNRVGQEAEWDMELLKLELEELDAPEMSGFDPDELHNILQEAERNTDADVIPEVPEDVISTEGDIWELGNHRLICGDSTNADHVKSLLGDIKPMLMVTDPPYGVSYDPKWRGVYGFNKNRKKMGYIEGDEKADWSEAWSLFEGNVAYVWHGALHAGEVQKNLEDLDFQMRQQIIWAKERFAISRGNYHWQHEACWYAVRKNSKANWMGDRSQTTLWKINSRDAAGHGHATQKPVECMKKPIENNSSVGHAVYEPFSGSGTTLIACEITARQCLAVEINPQFVDVAIQRWCDFTGNYNIKLNGKPLLWTGFKEKKVA